MSVHKPRMSRRQIFNSLFNVLRLHCVRFFLVCWPTLLNLKLSFRVSVCVDNITGCLFSYVVVTYWYLEKSRNLMWTGKWSPTVHFWSLVILISLILVWHKYIFFHFSALTLLVWCPEGHPACKNAVPKSISLGDLQEAWRNWSDWKIIAMQLNKTKSSSRTG